MKIQKDRPIPPKRELTDFYNVIRNLRIAESVAVTSLQLVPKIRVNLTAISKKSGKKFVTRIFGEEFIIWRVA
jgi:hypothetical protein